MPRPRERGAPARRGRARTPLYRELARALQRDIEAGVHPVGTLLPPEARLCARFGVSRHTAREALRVLRDLGLVTRRQGSGTQVVAASTEPLYTQSLASVSDLLQYAESTYLELDRGERIVARAAVARLLRSAPGQRWMRFRGVRRTAAGAPVCTTEVYLDARVAAVSGELGKKPGAIYKLIEEVTGVEVSEVRQEIAGVVLDADTARALDARPGAAGLRIVRRYLDHGARAFEVSVSVHPADRFTYSMRIRRDNAE